LIVLPEPLRFNRPEVIFKAIRPSVETGAFMQMGFGVWRALARRLGAEKRPKDIATVREGFVLQVPKPLVKELGLRPEDRVRWSVKRKRLVGEKV